MGFKGSESKIHKTVRTLWGRSQNIYVPLSFAAGDAMQIDWGEAYAYIDGVRTKLNGLGYSCFCRMFSQTEHRIVPGRTYISF